MDDFSRMDAIWLNGWTPMAYFEHFSLFMLCVKLKQSCQISFKNGEIDTFFSNGRQKKSDGRHILTTRNLRWTPKLPWMAAKRVEWTPFEQYTGTPISDKYWY
jgi:hypothetical protein